MMLVRVTNETRGRELGDRVRVADRVWPRLRGLIARPRIEPGEGLVIVPCRGVHMYLMTYPLDVALVDRNGAVVALYRELAPGARTRWHADAHHAIELPPGTLAETGTQIGDCLRWQPLPRVGRRDGDEAPEQRGRAA